MDNGDGTATITGCDQNYSGAVIIPDSTNGLPVTGIWYNAFMGCTNLTSVTIPNSVTTIEIQAFAECSSLTNVTIGTNVTSIGGGAFQSCTSLTNVTIPNSVTSIGDAAFGHCTSLTSVTIPNSVTSIGMNAFSDCTSLTSVTIPNSVTGIGDAAFSDCTSMTNVMIGTNVTGIGDSMFQFCTSLTSVTIPNSVTSIGLDAFAYTSLTSVTIPNSVTGIAGEAFAYNTNLMAVYFLGNAPSLYSTSVFAGNNNATAYYLPGTTGWSLWWAFIANIPTALWLPQVQASDHSFGVRTNRFGFNITWASGQTVVVEACANLADSNWCPVATNTLTTGSAYFSDSQWTNYSGRFYRLRSP